MTPEEIRQLAEKHWRGVMEDVNRGTKRCPICGQPYMGTGVLPCTECEKADKEILNTVFSALEAKKGE